MDATDLVDDVSKSKRKRIDNTIQRKTISEHVRSNVPSISKASICIGHTLSNTFGWGVSKLRMANRIRLNNIIPDLKKFIRISMVEKQLFRETESSSIWKHSTVLCSYRTENTVFLWYFDPSGYIYNIEKQNTIYNDWSDRINKMIDHYTPTFFLSDFEDSFMTEEERNEVIKKYKLGSGLFYTYSVLKFLKYVKQNDNDFIEKADLKFKSLTIPKTNVVYITYILTLYVKRELRTERHEKMNYDFEIINPHQSMQSIGAQKTSNDGCIFNSPLDKLISERVSNTGACSVWSQMYLTWAKAIISQSSGSVEETRKSIVNVLSDIGMINSEEGFEILGKFYFTMLTRILNSKNQTNSIKISSDMMKVLNSFYNEIPQLEDDRSKSLYYNNVIKGYDIASSSLENQVTVNRNNLEVVKTFFIECKAEKTSTNLSEDLKNTNIIVNVPIARVYIDTAMLIISCKTNFDI